MQLVKQVSGNDYTRLHSARVVGCSLEKPGASYEACFAASPLHDLSSYDRNPKSAGIAAVVSVDAVIPKI